MNWFDKIRESISHLPKALRMVWRASRRLALLWLILLIVEGSLPILSIHLTKRLIDSLVSVLGAAAPVRPVLVAAALIAFIVLLQESVRGAISLVRLHQSERLRDYITALIQRKSLTVDYAFYEMPEFYDHLHRAKEESGYRSIALVGTLGDLLRDGITLAGMTAVMAGFGWGAPLLLLLGALPVLVVVIRHTRRYYDWRKGATEEERKLWYYDWLQTSREPAAEVRLFDLGDHFRRRYEEVRAPLREQYLGLSRRQTTAEFLVAILGLFCLALGLLWMGGRVLRGEATLGTLALFYQAFNNGQGIMRSTFGNLGQIYANSLFVGNLFEFLSLEPGIADPPHPRPAPAGLRHGIDFEGVSFRYPESERMALSDFSLHIPANRVTAIVGLNGAGKSTLVKLLCRLYDPSAGRITLDGVDLRDLRVRDLHKLITVMFQEPVQYNAGARENLQLGDLRAAGNEERLVAAARAAGADSIVSRLPHDYDSLLGKMFLDGEELSVGEWQRLALARAFFRDAPVLLLDEPTSAMDSWSENGWMARLRQLAAGKTTLLITHRFTTARQADLICVMVDGQVVESGTHDALVARNGYYAGSWLAQTARGGAE